MGLLSGLTKSTEPPSRVLEPRVSGLPGKVTGL